MRKVTNLNYIAEINAFYDWLESNPMGASAIVLWHGLMAIANKARWPRDFSVAISTLRSRTGLGKDAIYTARNLLKQKGRIDFCERKGNRSTTYRMIPFASDFASEKPTQTEREFPCVGITDANPDTTPTQTPTQMPSQRRTVINIDQTKQNQTGLSSVCQSPPAPLVDASDGTTTDSVSKLWSISVPEGWESAYREALTRMSNGKGISVDGRFISASDVRERFRELTPEIVRQAVDKLPPRGEVRKPVAYLMACLYNSPGEFRTNQTTGNPGPVRRSAYPTNVQPSAERIQKNADWLDKFLEEQGIDVNDYHD